MHVSIIGLAGPSASGKSTLARRAALEVSGLELLQLDKFYKNSDEFPMTGPWRNWELPENVKFDELYLALTELKAGRPVDVPVYSKPTGRATGSRLVLPASIVLVEGFLLFHDARIRALCDLSIYLKVDVSVQRMRRLKREPGLDHDYYNQVVIPSFERYGAQAEGCVDIVIEADGTEAEAWEKFYPLLEE